jgi:hypothetical protein
MLPGEYLLRTLFGKEPGGQRLVLADRLQIVDDPKASIGDGPELRLGFLYLSDVHENLYRRTIIVVHLRWQSGRRIVWRCFQATRHPEAV